MGVQLSPCPPMDNKSQTLDTYNRSAQAMADKFNAIGPRVRDIAQVFSYIPKPEPVVFEIGCGNGRDAKEILKRTPHYLGIDYSSALLEMAKADLPKAHFELADVDTYTIPQGVDIIFAFASLLHSEEESMRSVLSRAYEALNQGGALFLSLRHGAYKEEPVTDSWGTRIFYLYTPAEIMRLAPQFKNLFEYVHTTKDGKEWFEMVLQK